MKEWKAITTSKRLPSPATRTPTSKSRTKTLHETRPQTLYGQGLPNSHMLRGGHCKSSGRRNGRQGLPKATQEQNVEQLRGQTSHAMTLPTLWCRGHEQTLPRGLEALLSADSLLWSTRRKAGATKHTANLAPTVCSEAKHKWFCQERTQHRCHSKNDNQPLTGAQFLRNCIQRTVLPQREQKRASMHRPALRSGPGKCRELCPRHLPMCSEGTP